MSITFPSLVHPREGTCAFQEQTRRAVKQL
jgi:hypothetical protein